MYLPQQNIKCCNVRLNAYIYATQILGEIIICSICAPELFGNNHPVYQIMIQIIQVHLKYLMNSHS